MLVFTKNNNRGLVEIFIYTIHSKDIVEMIKNNNNLVVEIIGARKGRKLANNGDIISALHRIKIKYELCREIIIYMYSEIMIADEIRKYGFIPIPKIEEKEKVQNLLIKFSGKE